MNKKLDLLTSKALKRKPLTRNEARYISSDKADIWDVLHGANIVRQRFHGNKIHLCSIINAKSGNCAEDCKFCAQSSHHKTKVNTYSLVDGRTIKKAYLNSKDIGADGFSIVTSGNQLSRKEIDLLAGTISQVLNPKSQSAAAPPANRGIPNPKSGATAPYVCASIGYLRPEYLQQLKEAGLSKFHHNLETSRRYFKQVCSTHSYDERIETVKAIKKAGLKTCSGGIFGIGETWQDRIDLAFTLKELGVDSVPLNFLIPIKGTSMAEKPLLTPYEALKIIALYRYILPETDIRICAGREKVLRDLQSLIYFAGATGMMIGGYLTQPGRSSKDDLQMVADLGLRPAASSF